MKRFKFWYIPSNSKLYDYAHDPFMTLIEGKDLNDALKRFYNDCGSNNKILQIARVEEVVNITYETEIIK